MTLARLATGNNLQREGEAGREKQRKDS